MAIRDHPHRPSAQTIVRRECRTAQGVWEGHVDLAVLLRGPSPSLRALGELAVDLQPFYPGGEIDLALINRADPLFLKKITENCRLVFGDLRRLHELKMYAFRRYQDHRRYLAFERSYLDGVLRTLAPP